MKRKSSVTTLFLDIGGVLLTDSCYVHLRKPDPEIFRLALNIAHVSPEQVLYIDNQPLFVKIAEGLGIPSFHHTDYMTTLEYLTSHDLLPQKKIMT